MKKFRYIIVLSIFLLLVSFSSKGQSRGPGDPPSPPGNHGNNNHQDPGGGAPISGGITTLLTLASAYMLCKIYCKKNNKLLD